MKEVPTKTEFLFVRGGGSRVCPYRVVRIIIDKDNIKLGVNSNANENLKEREK